MAERRQLRQLLAVAALYDLLQIAMGSNRSHRRFVTEYLRPAPNDRLLDLGCGPGRILRALPAGVRYLGIDLSPDYIAAAEEAWGDRGEFRCADVRDVDVPAGAFDLVMTMGVLHHLDDASCERMLSTAAGALRPGGRFVAIEPARETEQPAIARWLIDRDRGDHVRSTAGYAALAALVFPTVGSTTRHDLLRVPYTHALLGASLGP